MVKSTCNTRMHVMRFSPGEDPRLKIEAYMTLKEIKAAVLVTAVGSLNVAKLRFANQKTTETLRGHFEILSLTGTLSHTGGSHLHLCVSDENGKTIGGHLMEGSEILTTLEVAIAEISDLEFSRSVDKVTGYKELKVDSVSPSDGAHDT